MIAVTTQSQSWVLAAGIAAVVIPLYFAFIFREFVLCRLSDFAWLHFPNAARIVATVATWGRATKRHAVHSPSPRVDGQVSRRGVSYEQSGPALALRMVGDEFDQIEWKGFDR
jgi:hypothetical protein